MTRNKILSLIFSATMVFSLAGCSETNNTPTNDPVDRWEMTKENLGTAKELTFSTRTEDGNKYYLVSNYEQFLNGELSNDDILFFDFGKAYKIMTAEDYAYDYLAYETMKSCAIEFTSISTDADLTQFTVTAPKGSSNKACVVVNKDKTTSGEYVFATISDYLTADFKTPQEQFEEDYGKAGKGALVAKTVTALSSGIVSAIIGGVISEPGLISCGIVNLINGIVGLFSGLRDISTRDIMEKLYVIESRLIDIEKKMSDNFSAIRSDSKVTQAKIDFLISQVAQQNIDKFEKEDAFDLEAYSNVMSNTIKGELKNIALRTNYKVEIPYYYNSDNVIAYRPLTEVAANESDKKIEVIIPSFPNALDALKKSSNIFDSTVHNEFTLDIYNALEGVALPEQMTREILCDYVFARMTEEIIRAYYTIQNDQGVKYMNLVLKFAKSISGEAGETIISSYKTRFGHMYNFGKEAKTAFNTSIARLRHTLETHYGSCMIACLWCGTDFTKLANAYDAALQKLIDVSTSYNKMADNYSFIIDNNVSANLYSSYTESKFTSYGNFPTHYNEFILYRHDSENINERVKIDSSKYISNQQITSEQHFGIILRMNYLARANVVSENISYYDYLIKTGILNSNTSKAIQNGIEQKKILNNPYQFISDINHRGLTQDDKKQILCYFTDRGSEKMYYFHPGEWCPYKNRHSDEYWHATCWETYAVDAVKNEVSTNKWVIGLEGCYDEGHKRWINDERHRFNGNPNDIYFLAMAKAN